MKKNLFFLKGFLAFLMIFVGIQGAWADTTAGSDAGSSVSKSGYTLVFSSETSATASTYLTSLTNAEKANCTGSFANQTALETYWDYSPKATSTWNRYMGSTLDEKRTNVGYSSSNPGTIQLKANEYNSTWLTSGVETKQYFQYGIIEVKAKCNAMTGNFPAIWLMPANQASVSWPSCGEIDMMEMINDSYGVYSTIHYGNSSNVEQKSTNNANVKADGNYHIYTMKWTSSSMTFYKDGSQYWTYSFDSSKPFNQPYRIILNQAVGDGSWASNPVSGNEYEMDVAYVRVYQNSSESPSAYTITRNSSTGGSVSASLYAAASGTSVTLGYTANDGYTFDSYTVTDASGNAVTVTDGTFTMPSSNVTVTANFTGSSTETPTFKLKTSGTIDTSKKYLIVYQDGTTATSGTMMSSSFTSSSPSSSYGQCAPLGSSVTISSNVIETSESNAFTFETVTDQDGKYYVKNNAGYYFGNYSSGSGNTGNWFAATNDLSSTTASYYYNTVSFSNSAAVIGGSYNGATLGYQTNCGGTSGNCGFYYGWGSAIYLYEQVDDYAINCTATNGTLTSDKSTADAGETVTLTVTPDDGYVLSSLTVNGSDVTSSVTSGTYTFTMPSSDVTVTATFSAAQTYTVTCNTATNGSITADKTSATEGETVTLTVTPDSGYALNTLAVTDADGNNVTVSDNKFTMPASNVTVTATFSEITTYSITCTSGTGGSVSANPTSAEAGTTVTLTVTTETSYTLKSLKVNGTDVTSSVTGGTYTFTMPSSNVTVTAKFESSNKTFKLKTSGSIDPTKKYLIVYQSSASAPSGILMSSDFTDNTVTISSGNRSQTVYGAEVGSTVYPSSNQITTDESNAFTFSSAGTDGVYYIMNNAERYFGTNSNNQGNQNNGYFAVSQTSGTDYQNTVSIASTGVVTIKGNYSSSQEGPWGTTTNYYYLNYTSSQGQSSTNYFTYTTSNNNTLFLYEEETGEYKVTCSATNGTITSSKSSADEDDEITLTATPSDGYSLASLTVTYDGGTVSTTKNSDGTYSFTMPAADVTVTATFDKAKFVLKTSGTIDPTKKYLMVYKASADANSGVLVSSNISSGASGASGTEVTEVSSGVIETGYSNAYSFTTATGNYYYIQSYTGYYIGSYGTAESSTGYFSTSTSKGENYYNTINIYSDGSATILGVLGQSNDAYSLRYDNHTTSQTQTFFYGGWSVDGGKIYIYEESRYQLTSDTKNVKVIASKMLDSDIQGALDYLDTNGTKNANSIVYVEDNTYNVPSGNNNVAVKGTDTYTCPNFVITDAVDISIPIAFTASNATYVRKSTSTVGTLILPYAPITKNDSYKYYELTQETVDESASTAVGATITFTSISGNPQPNVPYFYSNSTGENFDLSTENASVVVTAKYPDPDVYSVPTQDGNWNIVGVYEKTTVFAEENGGDDYSDVYSNITNYKTVDANSYYIKDVKHFAKVNGYFNNLPFRAYFSTTAENAAKFSSFTFNMSDATEDAINAITNPDDEIVGYYNVNGIEMNGMQKGLNILKFKSGKTVKVMIK